MYLKNTSKPIIMSNVDAVKIVVILYCLGNSDKEESILLYRYKLQSIIV